jgi:hypothetical protein
VHPRAQVIERGVETRLQRAQRDAEHLGGLRVREVAVITEKQEQPVVGRKTVKRGGEFSGAA